jgi:hypothetical protein
MKKLAVFCLTLIAVLFLSIFGNVAVQAASSTWNIQTVIGQQCDSMVLDSNGNPHIVYYDSDYLNGGLKYAAWNGSKWNIQKVLSTAECGNLQTGGNYFLVLDSKNNPNIIYFSLTYFYTDAELNPNYDYDLKCASWTGSCWQIQTIDCSTEEYVNHISRAFDSKGNLHISYCQTNCSLIHASRTGSNWDIQVVDPTFRGDSYSLAFDSSGNLHISYYDEYDDKLKYASWTGTCWDIQTVYCSGGRTYYNFEACSLVLDSKDNPHIIFYDKFSNDIIYAVWTGSTWNNQTLVSNGIVYGDNSLVLDTNGNPHICYYDATNYDLKYVFWTGSNWNIQTVDSNDDKGLFTSIALDLSGNPHISYYDINANVFKFASLAPVPSLTGTATLTPTDTSSNSPSEYLFEILIVAAVSVAVAVVGFLGWRQTKKSNLH